MSSIINNISFPWHYLISKASNKCDIKLSEDLKSYLIFLLMRFIQRSEFFSGSIAIDFLSSQRMVGQSRFHALRNVGDKCLLISGLFPASSRKRHVRIDYYVTIGRNSYRLLGETKDSFNNLFIKLSDNFINLMDILQATRESNDGKTDLLMEEELLSYTNSKYAKIMLSRHTGGKFIFPVSRSNTDSSSFFH